MTGLIAKREFSVLLASKAHRISIILIALLIIAGSLVGRYFMNKESTPEESTPEALPALHIGLETQMDDFSSALSNVTVEHNLPSGSSEKWIKERILEAKKNADEEKSNDSAEVIYMALGGTAQQPLIYTSQGTIDLISGMGASNAIKNALVTSTVEKITGTALTAQQQTQIASSMNPTIIPVTTEKSTGFDANPIGYMTGLFSLMILFTAVITGSTTISQGIVEEKSSRVVEILLSTVKPRQLLLGKLLGIGAFILIQIGIWLVCGIIGVKILGIDVNISLGYTALATLCWMIVGFFIFATLIAGMASRVSRQEDLAAVQTPVIFGMLIPFYLAVYLIPFQPDSLLTKILSFVPGFSSFMMPMRQSLNAASTWELAISFIIAIASIPLFAALSGRIYENSVLRMGKQVSFKEALRANTKV